MIVWGLSQPVTENVLAYDSKPERWPVSRENLAHNGLTGYRRLAPVEGWFLGGEDVECSLAALQALPEPVLLKIAVDGGEEAILQKLAQVLPSKRMLVLIETYSEALDRACRQLLTEGGYHARSIKPAWWRAIIKERRPIGFNQWIAAERPAVWSLSRRRASATADDSQLSTDNFYAPRSC